ncbi:MAG: glycerophosphodiester phosphodiesterase [Halobacteriaceae archaeon]
MPDLFAHRGFALEYPENTVAAVRGAVEAGADVIELDARRAASGEVVVHHDATVDRVTESSGPVNSFSAAELAELNVMNSGEGIPTLAQVVAALPPDVGLNVELKEVDLATDIVRVLEDSSTEVLLSSFSETALENARADAPAVDRALLVDRRPRTAVDRARSLGCTAIHPRARLCVRSLLVRRAHAAGLAVNAWTLRSPRLTRWLIRLGVDGVIADIPAVLE